jgi:hypothetical protein
MLTDLNAKQMRVIYNMCETTYHSYLSGHREILKELATKRVKNGRIVIRRDYNSAQLKYLLEHVFKDTPPGYDFDGETLIPISH